MGAGKKSGTLGEVIGLVLLGLGALLFLALISYDPGDLPSWVFFSHKSPPNSPVQNFVGPVGAVIGGVFYFFLGAASYLVAVILLGYGGVKLFNISLRILPRLGWVVLFVITAACLLQLQGWFLQSWREEFKIPGPGGWVGAVVGGQVLARYLGEIGSAILLTAAYLSSLILMTGIRPVALIRKLRSEFQEYLAKKEKSRLKKASVKERLTHSQKKLEREQRKLEKRLKKQGVQLPTEEQEEAEGLPQNLPEPKIIDTSAPSNRRRSKPQEEAVEVLPNETLQAREAVSFADYELPDITLLDEQDRQARKAADPDELRRIQSILVDTLAHFGISVSPGDITRGPTITRFEVYPARGVRVDKIVSLERDLARATRAERINILAPIPGKDTVGIEIANSRKVKVTLREVLESQDPRSLKGHIPLALGKDVYGKTILADLAQMPHCLIAGTTGSGKSVCVNAMIASMLFRFTPDELRFVMIDPKVVELQMYNQLPHLVVPVVNDPKKVLLALRWVTDEMERRYQIFAKCGVRNIISFNAHRKRERKSDRENAEEAGAEETEKLEVPRDGEPEIPDHMPYIVVIIDELADLMQTSPADVESAIARITQMARAAGIHMIVATQTPRADVVTGVIKANIPTRIAFQVASKLDSRVILDENGAERLLGQGDMLYLPPGSSKMTRAQGVLVTDEEIARIVEFCSAQNPPAYEAEIHERLQSDVPLAEDVSPEDEELIEKCLEVIRQEKRASTSLLQRRLRLGYTRAARIVDILEQRGILGPGEGAKPREILVDLDNFDIAFH